jgi:RNA polymerase sigma-70 factor (ECF subfamily)
MPEISLQELEVLSVEKLVLLAQAGNREALGVLLPRFDRVIRNAWKGKWNGWNDPEFEDFRQDVFLKVIQKLNQIRNPKAFPGWISRIAKRMAINLSSRKKFFVSLAEATNKKCEEKPALEVILAGERRDLVMVCLSRIPELDRTTLVKYYLEDQSVREIANNLKVPKGTVQRRLSTARGRFKDQYLQLMAA